MTTTFKTGILRTVALVSLVVISGVATAGEPAGSSKSLYLVPNNNGGTPKLGFTGHFEYGYGLVIDRVNRFSVAERTGLEPGDVLTAVNGQRLRSVEHYQSLLRNKSGKVLLQIRDVRTNRYFNRVAYLYGRGPSRPYEDDYGHGGHDHDHHGNHGHHDHDGHNHNNHGQHSQNDGHNHNHNDSYSLTKASKSSSF